MTTTIAVAKRLATMTPDGPLVAGNTYPVTLSFDSEWSGTAYLRVRFGSLYYDIPLSISSSSATADVQLPVGYPEVGLGVYSEALEISTNEARLKVLRSILEAGEEVVSFDGDLYDQWAGEVSEVVCDSAFSPTSARPVKNSVLTAWKSTVPLDSAVVHTTGDEVVGGTKTFKGGVVVGGEDGEPTVTVDCGASGESAVVLSEEGTEVARLKAEGYLATEGEAGIETPDGDLFGLKAVDGDLYAVAPTAPSGVSDGGAIITKDGLASESSVVHTSGNETVGGNKTFSDPVRVGTPTATGHAVDLGTLTTKLGDGSVTKVGTANVGTDSTPVKLVAGVPTAVGSALAVDSATVHNTGDETVAGEKLFTAPIRLGSAAGPTIGAKVVDDATVVYLAINDAGTIREKVIATYRNGAWS